MQQTDPFALFRRQAFQLQARFRDIERSARYIHPYDFSKLMVGKKSAKQLALAATEIEH